MRLAFVLILIIHALLHSIGVIKTFGPQKILPKSEGVAWLLVAAILVLSLAGWWVQWPFWWWTGLVGVMGSQILILRSWKLAKWGTLGNLLFFLPIGYNALQSFPTSFQNRYRKEMEEGLRVPVEQSLLQERDIQHLPRPVQKYLRFTKSLGKPIIDEFKIAFEGEMKQKLEGEWMPIWAEQCTFWNIPERAFYIQSNMWGIPFDGFHLFKGPSATMQIKVAALFQVVDAHGPQMDQSETVTMFNDMCLMSPSRWLREDIVWNELDSLTVEAQFKHQGRTITAWLYFDAQGRLSNFKSNDRFLSEDGISYESYPWSTPVLEYKDYEGYYLPAYAEAIWQTPRGLFCYARFRTKELEFNRLKQ